MHSNNKNINMKSNILSEINNIADDHRFHRIFSQVNDNACVLQLWIALIHNGPITEKKIIYGRLLPYRHSDMTWHLIENSILKLYRHNYFLAANTAMNYYKCSFKVTQ